GRMEIVDRLARPGLEGDVRAATAVGAGIEPLRRADPEARMVAAIAMGDDTLAGNIDRVDAGIADGGEHRVVEALGLGEVGDADGDVIDHRLPPKGGKPPIGGRPPPPIPPAPPFMSAAMPWRIRPFCPSLETCFIM